MILSLLFFKLWRKVWVPHRAGGRHYYICASFAVFEKVIRVHHASDPDNRKLLAELGAKIFQALHHVEPSPFDARTADAAVRTARKRFLALLIHNFSIDSIDGRNPLRQTANFFYKFSEQIFIFEI